MNCDFEKIIIKDRIIEKFLIDKKEKEKLIRQVANISLKKVEHTINSWQKRNKIQIFSDFLLGDLAKTIYKNYLFKLGLNLIDYDEVRIDDFKNPDEFDLKFENQKIEVKSSLEKYTTKIEEILLKRNIIKNKNSIHFDNSDITSQVFFIPKQEVLLKEAKSFEDGLSSLEFSDESVNLIIEKILNCFDVYLLGWVEKKQFKNESFSLEKESLNSDKRDYFKFLINDANNNNELPFFLKNTKSKTYCFIDTETTGKTPTKDRIVEFAGVKYKDGVPTEEVLNILINPERAIPLETTEIHGITDDDVKDKPKFKAVMGQILDFIRGTRVIAHNGVDFDFKILEEEFKRNDSTESFAEAAGELVDSLLIARKVRPGKAASINALCKEYNVDNTQRVFHGALLDCELLAEVYKGLEKDIKEKNIDLTVDHELDLPRKNPIKRIKDGKTGIYVKVTEEQLAEHQVYVDEMFGVDAKKIKLSV